MSALSVEDEEYNTVIDGHGEGMLKGTQSSSSKVPEMTPEKAIASEKCVVFTDIIMSLLKSVYGNVCKHKDCGCLLEYRKTYRNMSCGLMEVQCWPLWWKMGCPTNMQVRAGNLTLASSLLFSGNSFRKVGMMFKFCNIQFFFHKQCFISTRVCTLPLL